MNDTIKETDLDKSASSDSIGSARSLDDSITEKDLEESEQFNTTSKNGKHPFDHAKSKYIYLLYVFFICFLTFLIVLVFILRDFCLIRNILTVYKNTAVYYL